MGFLKPDLDQAYSAIRKNIGEIRSPYNDGYTSCYCKKDLYMLKCWLEEEYDRLPKFTDEKDWDQERLIEKLRQKEPK